MTERASPGDLFSVTLCDRVSFRLVVRDDGDGVIVLVAGSGAFIGRFNSKYVEEALSNGWWERAG